MDGNAIKQTRYHGVRANLGTSPMKATEGVTFSIYFGNMHSEALRYWINCPVQRNVRCGSAYLVVPITSLSRQGFRTRPIMLLYLC